MTVVLRRLSRASAATLIQSLRTLHDIADVTAELTFDDHPDLTWPAVGNERLSASVLTLLREDLTALAGEHGFPHRAVQLSMFDARAAAILREALDLTPHEASQDDAWTYLTCCWLLDLAAWRFSGSADQRRFLGDVNRNTWRRLWWRAELLYPEVDLRRLGEDELVNLTERPTLAANRRLAQLIASEFILCYEGLPTIHRSNLMREATKRLLRRTPFVDFNALADATLLSEVRWSLDAAVAGLTGNPIPPRPELDTPTFAVSASVQQLSTLADGGAEGHLSMSQAGEIAVELAERAGRVTNSDLRQLLNISSAEATAVLNQHMASGVLLRRGIKRGTYYVLAGETLIQNAQTESDESGESSEKSLPTPSTPSLALAGDEPELSEEIPHQPLDAEPVPRPHKDSPAARPTTNLYGDHPTGRPNDSMLRRLLRRGR